MWHIADVEIPNRLVVAPMAGVTNAAFRVTAKEFGAGLVVCEMISDRGIMYKNKKTSLTSIWAALYRKLPKPMRGHTGF